MQIESLFSEEMDLPSSSNYTKIAPTNTSIGKDVVAEDAVKSPSSSRLSSDGGVTTEEDVFEVEKIIGHKIYEGKNYWKVRWVGYGPSDDTWEPRENFLDKKVLKMLNDFETERFSKKEKRKEMTRKSNEYSCLRKKQESDEESPVDEKNDSWFGIKKDEGPREQRRLFVSDRVLSKTEKLLTEIGSSPGVRILRRHLTDQSVDRLISPSIGELTPEKGKPQKTAKKRRNQSSDFVFTSESSSQEVTEPVEKNAQILPKESKETNAIQKTFVAKETIKEVEKREKKLAELAMKAKLSEIDAHNSELGISKSLKPKKLAKLSQRPKLKEAIKTEDVLKKKRKDDKIALKKSDSSKDTTHKSKDKTLSKLALVRPGETGLMVPFASEGINVAATIQHFTKDRHVCISANDTSISQEEFEEMVMDGKVEKVRQLLQNGQASKSFDLNRVDEFGKTLLHKLCEIKCGVSHTQCELIHLLVAFGGRLNIIESGNNQIPLHIAIANRRLCHVRQLLDLRSPVNLVDKSGKSPLILALDCSDIEFMRCLLRAGASFQPALEKLYEDKDRNKRQFRFVTDHETQLRKALNAARDAVAMNLSVKCISPIFVNPAHEKESEHFFTLNSQPQLPVGDYAYLLFASVAEFLQDDRDKDSDQIVEARMWGQISIRSVTMNGKVCQQLKQGNKFAFFCAPCQGENQIKLSLEPVIRKSRIILLTQVVLAQSFRQTLPSTAGHRR